MAGNDLDAWDVRRLAAAARRAIQNDRTEGLGLDDHMWCDGFRAGLELAKVDPAAIMAHIKAAREAMK